MKVKVLLVTHEHIGTALLKTITRIFVTLPFTFKVITVSHDCDLNEIMAELQPIIDTTNHKEGLLILTDVYGSTPCNAVLACKNYKHVHVVSGLNLPMLIKIINYADLPLHALAQKAIQGGRNGIINCTQELRSL